MQLFGKFVVLIIVLVHAVMIQSLRFFLTESRRPATFRLTPHPSITKLFSTSKHSRPESNKLSLDANFAGSHPEIVIAHLHSRSADPKLIESISKLTELKVQRSKLIVEGDSARSRRKTLSKDIGILMKAGKKDDAEKLKLQVEEANQQASKADSALIEIDHETNRIFSIIPNFLDDR